MENTQATKPQAIKPQAINTFVVHRNDNLDEVVIELMQDYPSSYRDENGNMQTIGNLESIFVCVLTRECANKLKDVLVHVCDQSDVNNPNTNEDVVIH